MGKFYLDLRLSPADEWVKELWKKGFYPFKLPFVYEIKGKFYPVYPPLFPLLSSPFYLFFGDVGLYVIPVLSFLVLILQVWLLCRNLQFNCEGEILSIIVISFGSPLLIYGMTFWEFTLAAALAFTGFAKLVQRNPSETSLIIGSFFLGISIWIRPECLFFAFLVLGFCFVFNINNIIESKWIIIVAFGISLAIFIFFNVYNYGFELPFGIHARESIENIKNNSISIIRNSSKMVLLLFDTFSIFIPFTICIIILSVTHHNNYIKMLILIVFSLLISIIMVVPNYGGIQWGPRYLFMVFPIISIGIGVIFKYLSRFRFLISFSFIIFISHGVIANSFYGVKTLNIISNERVLPAIQFINERPEKNIIFYGENFVPLDFVTVKNKNFFFVEKREEGLRFLIEFLKKRQEKFLVVFGLSGKTSVPEVNKYFLKPLGWFGWHTFVLAY